MPCGAGITTSHQLPEVSKDVIVDRFWAAVITIMKRRALKLPRA
jgi:hypothetical protein